MKFFHFIKNIIFSLYKSLRRYPLSIGFSILTTIILIVLAHYKIDMTKTTSDKLIRGAMIFAIGIPLTLCIKHIHERMLNIKLTNKVFSYILGLAFLLFYYFFLLKTFDNISLTRYIALSISLYLAFLYIPYFFSRTDFELYIIKLLSRFFVTILYAIILFLGISAILFTVNELLKISISSKTYYDVFLIITGIISPSFFLSGVPLLDDELKVTDYPKLLRILLIYIVMPLLTAYTIILYIYFAKIILTLQWPIQLVMHLVLWYSFLSTAVIFLTSILIHESNWVKLFHKWYTKLLLPLLIMLFVSVGKRINSYGITEARYFVLVLGLWVLGIMLYLILKRKPKNIILPVTLSIIAILCVVGPWSAYSVSKYSQNHRLIRILSKYHMLYGNKLVKAKIALTSHDKTEINQILNYFSNYHKLKEVSLLPKNFELRDMEKTFGFPSQFDTSYYNQNKYFSYDIPTPQYPIAVAGYDYFMYINGSNLLSPSIDNKLKITYDISKNIMKIVYNEEFLGNISLQKYGENLNKKLGIAPNQERNAADMTFNFENTRFKAKIIIINISGHTDVQSESTKIDYVNFYFLIKLK